jgi:hypothetical protein
MMLSANNSKRLVGTAYVTLTRLAIPVLSTAVLPDS